MRALVVSGGGSKGAFAGGVAQYLMEIEKKEKAEILDIEIKSFSKNLKKDDLKIVDESFYSAKKG